MSDRTSSDERISDYLWDGSGTPDPEIEALETLLAPLGSSGEAQEAPRGPSGERLGSPGEAREGGVTVLRARQPALWLAAAAVLALVLGGVWSTRRTVSQTLVVTGYSPTIDLPSPVEPGQAPKASVAWAVQEAMGAWTGAQELAGSGQLRAGEWLETRDDGRATVEVADIGTLEIQPNTRLKLVASGEREHRVALERGEVHAVIDAPPRLFIVETPSAVAVDLGCVYTLTVTAEGKGLLRVASGWVELEAPRTSPAGYGVVVPHGASARLRAGGGSSVPLFDDARPAFSRALEALEAGDDTALAVLRAKARPRDSLSLWHLARRSEGEGRLAVIDAMLGLRLPLPAGFSAANLGAADDAMLMAWRERLWPVWDAPPVERQPRSPGRTGKGPPPGGSDNAPPSKRSREGPPSKGR